MSTHTVVLIPGDGIGPDITKAVRRILEAAGADIQWVEHQAGIAALTAGDEVLPVATTQAILEHKIEHKSNKRLPGRALNRLNNECY